MHQTPGATNLPRRQFATIRTVLKVFELPLFQAPRGQQLAGKSLLNYVRTRHRKRKKAQRGPHRAFAPPQRQRTKHSNLANAFQILRLPGSRFPVPDAQHERDISIVGRKWGRGWTPQSRDVRGQVEGAKRTLSLEPNCPRRRKWDR